VFIRTIFTYADDIGTSSEIFVVGLPAVACDRTRSSKRVT